MNVSVSSGETSLSGLFDHLSNFHLPGFVGLGGGLVMISAQVVSSLTFKSYVVDPPGKVPSLALN
ncbi:MAG: hypothetical protein MJ233_02350 [Mycoplasmoidaceae bacterium]|nr:hypothetical protein [Mycoplasmoidaceae bacterium]